MTTSSQAKVKYDHDRARALDLGARLNDDLQRRISGCNDAPMRMALQSMLSDLIELQRLASVGAVVETEQPSVAEMLRRHTPFTVQAAVANTQAEANHG